MDDWAKDEDCVTISRPNGVGALQVSAYRKDNGKITDEELLEATDSDATSREKFQGQTRDTNARFAEFFQPSMVAGLRRNHDLHDIQLRDERSNR
ncbi:MAG: hypothetical protein IPG67_09625 [Acidobacteria bacterium]|nr:hypothetical protein [Acidobacteriota bacterium]